MGDRGLLLTLPATTEILSKYKVIDVFLQNSLVPLFLQDTVQSNLYIVMGCTDHTPGANIYTPLMSLS